MVAKGRAGPVGVGAGGFGGINPGKFWKFYVKIGQYGAKLHIAQ